MKNKNKAVKLSSKQEVEYEVLYKSLIGKDIEIINSSNKNQIGIKGKIIHETANFYVLSKNASNTRILKRNIEFKAFVKGKPLYIDGRLLFNTLTNRIKKIK
jgi:RNase P/RNase MRP subunit p29